MISPHGTRVETAIATTSPCGMRPLLVDGRGTSAELVGARIGGSEAGGISRPAAADRQWGVHPVAATRLPSGPAFDIVLLLHVACVVLGLAAVVVSGAQAFRLLGLDPAAPLPGSLRRYYAEGTNWAGRVLYGVPVLGFVLLATSRGAFGLDDGWVLWGLALWVAAALAAEGVLWPAERRVQGIVATGRIGAAGEGMIEPLRQACRQLVVAAAAVVVLLVAATVLMVARP